MKASLRCFLSALFPEVLHSAPINLTVSSLQWHFHLFLGLLLFFGIQCRTLIVHPSSFLLPRCPTQLYFNFYTLQMTSGNLSTDYYLYYTIREDFQIHNILSVISLIIWIWSVVLKSLWNPAFSFSCATSNCFYKQFVKTFNRILYWLECRLIGW